MRFLGVTETCDLGSLYMRLIEAGHEVHVSISEPLAQGTMAGLVPSIPDWRAQLGWIRDAGANGIIIFEAVSEGFGALQDELRADGFNVVGGSAFGDRLEQDRAFAQQLLSELGLPVARTEEFDDPAEAAAYVTTRPGRYVLKYCGPGHETGENFVGQADDGSDVRAMLAMAQPGARFVLMDFIEGVEMGVGAYFNGREFLTPACLDWEHKRFFAGDMGELTGEMGTVATFMESERFFAATLARVAPALRGAGHVGYVNLNTIVNAHGIWPLEFTCRFGYPGFAVLEPLQRTGWPELLRIMAHGDEGTLQAEPGYSVAIVLTTPPLPYSRKQVDAPVGLPVTIAPGSSAAEQRHLHYGEVGLANGRLVTSGLYGWTMVVTGAGPNVDEARAQAYTLAGRVLIPNGRYRLDIGERFAADYAALSALGVIGSADT